MKHLIVGTAGHVDHGKSQLVKALTGTDPDRLKEEKERGLTIDLGFAYFELPDGTRVGFVDVPGHEKFVKNMLAGAAGVDIVMLVVDATESVMPQTREHLDIMRLLGISRGLVVITKTDLADEEMMQIVEAEVEELALETFLEGAPVARVSSRTGEGVERLKNLLAALVHEQPQRSHEGLFRFPIDRVFTMRGFGTVATGTVFSGHLSEDEVVSVVPAGLSTRARQLQTHNMKVERVAAGMRAAMNLSGVSVQQLKRGDTLVRPGTAKPVELLDARVQLLRSAPRKLSRTSTVKLYVATSQQPARMNLIDKPQLAPGEQAYAQLRLQNPLCIFRGDRFVIRGGSPEFTIGGGVALDIAPRKARRKREEKTTWLKMLENAPPEQAAHAFLSQSPGGATVGELAVRMGEPVERLRQIMEPSVRSGRVISLGAGEDVLTIRRDRLELLKNRVAEQLSRFFKTQPHRLFMPREELRSRLGAELDPRIFETLLSELVDSGRVEILRDGVNLKGRRAELSKEQDAVKQELERIYRESEFAPPSLSQAENQFDSPTTARRMISLLLEEGTLIKISFTLAYHSVVLQKGIEKISKHFQQVDKLSVGDLKTILGISRKHAVPLLEYLDRTGVTSRVGDYRVLRRNPRE